MQKHLPWLLASLLFISQTGYAQPLSSLLGKYTSTNGVGYLQPLNNAFSLNFNSGFAHSARVPHNAFRVTLSLETMLSVVPEGSKTFMATTDDYFTPQQTAEVPTIFGSTQGAKVAGDGGTFYQFPGGVGTSYLPLAIPQLSIGGVFGTEVTTRFGAYDAGGDVGKFSYLALGGRHSLSQYMGKSFPVDISIGAYWQKLNWESELQNRPYLSFKSLFFQALIGKSFGVFHLYGGPGYEMGESTMNYTSSSGSSPVDISLNFTEINLMRFTAGMGLNLGPLFISTDYSLAKIQVWHTSIGLNIGKKDRPTYGK